MPWKSDKQRRWGHTAAGLKALGGKKGVAEWDSATKSKKRKKSIPQMYRDATKGLQDFGGKIGKAVQGAWNSRVQQQKNYQDQRNAGGMKNYYGTNKEFNKKKPRIGVDNKMKGSYGETIIRKGEKPIIKINVKRHKGNKAELADTIKHEMYHAKHPKATEKATYKAMPKQISPAEQDKLIAKLRNYKVGAAKRKLGISRHEKTEPGFLIRGMNERKQKRVINKPSVSPRERVAIMGM